ncbi:hypothetical protein B0H14DRAFT_117498 [Mycena olivaceomarginata]|nr:hypothetical protein B0H14DRAFT_117498 [Mycena olivaceomarginata]
MDIMLRSIIWQLSGRSPSPYSSLEKLYIELANGTIHPPADKLEKVLMDLLSELDQTYIIIDGLDECNPTDHKLALAKNQNCDKNFYVLNIVFLSFIHWQDTIRFYGLIDQPAVMFAHRTSSGHSLFKP